MSGRDVITPVAGSVPFDNSTNGLTSDNTQTAIEEVNAKFTSAGTGVTPPFLFARSGSTGSNSYLRIGDVNSNEAGQIIPGNNKIVRMTITSSAVYANPQTLQLQMRTGLNTRTDIVGAAVTIPGGSVAFSATVTFGSPISIGPNVEISAYLKTGNGVQNAVLLVYIVPA